MKQYALTTVDNPYSPFTEFESWISYDIQKGYYTSERLGSLVGNLPDSLSQDENNFFINEAMNELIKFGAYDKNGNFVEYKKLIKETND